MHSPLWVLRSSCFLISGPRTIAEFPCVALKLLLDLGKYYPQRGNLDGAKFKLLIMKFGP